LGGGSGDPEADGADLLSGIGHPTRIAALENRYALGIDVLDDDLAEFRSVPAITGRLESRMLAE
jgi:hypothetical protein